MTSLDPDIPLSGFYFFQYDKTHIWKETSAEGLTSLLASGNPPLYRTVLGRAEPFDEHKVPTYSGPFYVDIDVSPEMGGTSTAITQVNRLLANLEGLDVEPDSIRLFATGGRGFHLEIPGQVFGLRPGPLLPLAFRKLVESVFVDGVDLNVYSSRKGRMWRVPNRQRENGAYKVPVSPGQIKTAEDYDRLTSCPQPWPRLRPPSFAPALALKFCEAMDAVKVKTQARTQTSKAATALQTRFHGKLPPSLLGLLQGRFESSAGWNKIALQVVLAAHAAGLKEYDLIAQAKPLIDGHRGDGGRYSSPQAREAELRHQFAYVERAGYQFTVGGLKSIYPKGINTSDLRGLA